MQVWFNIQKSINVIHYINKGEKNVHLNKHKENIWGNPAFFHNKNILKSRSKSELFQSEK